MSRSLLPPKKRKGPEFHYAQPGSWRAMADTMLAKVYAEAKADGGRLPTKEELHDAYPFGFRALTPYSVWLQQLKWWAAGCPPKQRPVRHVEPLPGQQAVL